MDETYRKITRIEKYLAVIIGEEAELPEAPIYREEFYLAKIAGEDVELPTPIARIDFYLAKIAGMSVELPVPISRIDYLLAKVAGEDVPTPTYPLSEAEKYLLQWAEGGGYEETTVTGVSPLVLANAAARAIVSLTQYGKCEQASTPTPDASVPIMCNNGTIKFGALGANLFDPNPSAITLGWYIAANNGQVLESQTNFFMPQYIPVVGGEKYVFYGRHKTSDRMSSYNRIAFYSANKTYISTGDYTKDKIGTGTAPSNAAYARLSCNLSGESAATGTPVTYAIIADYNWTFAQAAEEIPYEPFVGGIYTDGTDEVLTVSGVNLFDKNTMDTGQGYYVNNSGNIVNGYNANRTVWVPCKPNTKYSYWHTGGAGGCRAFAMNKETIDTSDTSEWLKGSPASLGKNVVSTVTTPADAVKLYITAARSNLNPERSFDDQLADFMVVEGDVEEAFAYQPYVAPQTITDIPMLLSVGDYADEAEIISGIKTGRIGWHVFDGTESVGKSSAYGTAFYIQSAAGAWGAQKEIVMCSHYLGLGTASSASAVGTCFFNASGHFYFRVADNSDTAAFKAYLAAQYANGTPVIVFFALATETTEQTTAHALHTNEGDNTISVTANVSPIQLEITYDKKKGA